MVVVPADIQSENVTNISLQPYRYINLLGQKSLAAHNVTTTGFASILRRKSGKVHTVSVRRR
jgi:hypothetical protein